MLIDSVPILLLQITQAERGGWLAQAYASVQLNIDLKFSDSVYGLGSGIFFLGYMFFQVSVEHRTP